MDNQPRKTQQGFALIMLAFILGLVATTIILGSFSTAAMKSAREQKTAEALTEAKAAIIGWSINQATPGQLPCPEDTTLIGSPTEGTAQTGCSNAVPTIGRLPWRTLGLEDLRDGNGDSLWYVLSPGFRSSPINSDTPAQLTVDGTAGAAVAIIFSAGPPLNGQSRPVPTAAAPPDVTQYLDLSNNGGVTFISNGAATVFNDRLLLIKHDDLFKIIEKRVAGEALNCLNSYANVNGKKYPWPNQLILGSVASYTETPGTLFGRFADNPTSGSVPGWTASCAIQTSAWWADWKELVFYAVASDYAPTGSATGCGGCLTVNPPSAIADKHVVVLVAGQALAGQNRAADQGNISYYLEAPNNAGGVSFAEQNATSTFNDTVAY